MAQGAQRLLDAASEICQLKTTTRTKVLQDEQGRVYIFDCNHWSDECAYLLRFLCPNALVTVESSVSSLSGFIVVLQQETAASKGRQTQKRVLVAICTTLFIYFVIICLHFYVQFPLMQYLLDTVFA